MGVAVSKDQYKRACSVDLYEFLLQNHPSAVKVEYSSALLLADKHVSVKRGYHGYRNFRTDEKGNNIDYLMNFLGYSYPEAVLALIGESGVGPAYVPIVNPSILETKEIILPNPVNLIGVEIKVDINDLKNDCKMQEYTDFVDQFYLAVPDEEDIVNSALSIKLDSWGLLTVSKDGQTKVLQTADKLSAIMRDNTLNNLILKLL